MRYPDATTDTTTSSSSKAKRRVHKDRYCARNRRYDDHQRQSPVPLDEARQLALFSELAVPFQHRYRPPRRRLPVPLPYIAQGVRKPQRPPRRVRERPLRGRKNTNANGSGSERRRP